MRLYSGKITELSNELVKALTHEKLIECDSTSEVVKDFEAVFQNYLNIEREVNERARDMSQGRPQDLGRMRRLVADQKGIKVGEDMFDFLLDQLLEMLMHSNNVDEVYGEDHVLRKAMRPALKKALEVDEVIENEVRGKLKHVEEGSRTWEVEYQRVMAEIQRRRGLS
jgi:uncharacterized protein